MREEIFTNNIKINKIDDILKKINYCIINNKPFSHIRFGDGGIKFLYSIFYNDNEQLSLILKKEGIPYNYIVEIVKLWGFFGRNADFIDTPEVYYNNEFWPRIKKPGKPINYSTDIKMRKWRELYYRAEIINNNYCNPESNCLMILNIPFKMNLFDVLSNRNICVITNRIEVREKLKNIVSNIDIVKIVGQYENHYYKSFKKVMEIIKNRASKYDLWLVSAGELGRIYSGYIKMNGGRCLDIGFVIDYWIDQYLHPRFHLFMEINKSNNMELVLTENGNKYLEFI